MSHAKQRPGGEMWTPKKDLYLYLISKFNMRTALVKNTNQGFFYANNFLHIS